MSKKQIKTIYVICIVLFQFFIPINSEASQQHTGHLKVHFINVGQGDSILIETPDNKHILMDAGPPKAGKKIVSYLEDKNIPSIDLMIATHPDFDHIGGLPDVMEKFSVKHILETGKFHLTKTYATYAATVFLKQIPVTIGHAGDLIEVDDALRIEILNSATNKKGNNPSSLALKITYDEVDFLFMADVEKAQEKSMMKETDISADIIKIAHHGSKTSSSAPFLKEVQPSTAILTYGKSNTFGHPAPRVIDELQDLTSTIYSTAVFGNIVIESDGNSYIVLPEKSPFDAFAN